MKTLSTWVSFEVGVICLALFCGLLIVLIVIKIRDLRKKSQKKQALWDRLTKHYENHLD